jgi:hypothetical protein
MVGNREELPENTINEIQWVANEEITHAAHVAREAERVKRHKGLQDHSGVSIHEPMDGAHVRKQQPKFNLWCPTDQDGL